MLNVPVGKHTIGVSQTGFRKFEQEVEISSRKETRLDVQLALLEEVTAASRVTESVEDAPASVSIITYQELKAMEREEVIRIEPGGLVVRNRDALVRIVEADS